MPSSRRSSRPRDRTCVSQSLALADGFFTTGITCEVKVALSCLTLCDPIDYSLPISSVHGIRQARMLEWVAIPFSIPERSGTPYNKVLVIFFSNLFHSNIVGVQCLCSFLLQGKVIQLYIYIHSFSQSFPLQFITHIEYSSLYYTVRPCCFSILYIIFCIC